MYIYLYLSELIEQVPQSIEPRCTFHLLRVDQRTCADTIAACIASRSQVIRACFWCCTSVLQCVAVCCSVLQCAAVGCSVFTSIHTHKHMYTCIFMYTYVYLYHQFYVYLCRYIHIRSALVLKYRFVENLQAHGYQGV